MFSKSLIEVKNLMVQFPVRVGFSRTQFLKAVDNISFKVNTGETLGLVGESGCGKTTTARSLLHLENITSGKILFRGREISQAKLKNLRVIRKDMQVIFQDPYSSLDPRMRIGDIIGEPLIVHNICKKSSQEYKNRVLELLTLVGLEEYHVNRFAYEFSGGQRQRIGIARALATNPAFIICDEPVSALDVSIQSQIVMLLLELQKKFNLTFLFIAHDIAVVRNISNYIAVMYLGKIVELINSEALYLHSKHPYTRALISAVPIPDPEVELTREVMKIDGKPPSPLNLPQGCRFCTRCPFASEICRKINPELKKVDAEHWVSCHLIS